MITFDAVSFSYTVPGRDILRNLDLTIPEGDLCLVVGRTGSGKSTLLRSINGLVPHFTGGVLRGSVRVAGRDTGDQPPRDLADLVGYVGQVPVHGFVTDTVEEEIAYGMEQLGLAPATMRRRVEETLDLLGIADLRRRSLAALSGGQQQRVAIAAVLAAQPRVLVLDEPTSALDPTAAQDVLGALATLVHEVGLTVVLAEHRLERVMQAADSVLWLRGDGTAERGDPAELLARADVVPPLAELAKIAGWPTVPLSVRDARRRVERERLIVRAPLPRTMGDPSPALTTTELSVSYPGVRAVDRVSLSLTAGSVTALMGRNGSGKSSLLWALQGGVGASGAVRVDGLDPWTLPPDKVRRLVALVPQSAGDLLYLRTVGEECVQSDRESSVAAGTTARLAADFAGAPLPSEVDPRDLSEGQRLILVLAIQLASEPLVVLLDEPTRGLDYAAKHALAHAVASLRDRGRAVLISTHDVEFAALASERMLLLAEGQLIADGETHQVCTSSPVYAPQMAKVFAPVPLLTPAEVAEGLA